ncbi:MAG: response regulator [Solirubrobacteraceae bacterium]
MPAHARAVAVVVDDHEYSRRLVAHALGATGWEVHGASTLAEARALVAQTRPAAILLDLQLPDGSGLDLPATCRSATDPRPCVIVACTAGHRHDDEPRALAAGCDAYVKKPVDVHALPGLLRSLLRARGLESDAVSPVASAPAPLRPDDACQSATVPAGLP